MNAVSEVFNPESVVIEVIVLRFLRWREFAACLMRGHTEVELE